MSGSTLGISREKGGVQVREMMESSGIGVAVREPTAERRPEQHYVLQPINNKCTNLLLKATHYHQFKNYSLSPWTKRVTSLEYIVVPLLKVTPHWMLVSLYSTVMLLMTSVPCLDI